MLSEIVQNIKADLAQNYRYAREKVKMPQSSKVMPRAFLPCKEAVRMEAKNDGRFRG